jgi:hypothetical protein
MRYVLPALVLLLNPTTMGASQDRIVCLFIEDPSVVDWSILTNAKLVATAILKNGGVELKWLKSHRAVACAGWLITLNLSGPAPDSMPPDALGYSLPYATGRARVTVFLDRLRPLFARAPNWQGSLLGHVIVHELIHVLQGIARHTDYGLMKARWSEDDIQQMGVRPLGLTPIDVLLIRRGMVRHGTLCEE